MYNKKLIILLGSILSLSLYFLWSFGFAINLNVNLWDEWYIIDSDYFNKKISPIHFNDQENDFWWFIYFNQWSTWDIEVEKDGVRYECNLQVWWFYYNEQRWDMLWPLDKDTAAKFEMDSGVVSGGIYTRCRPSGYEDQLVVCNSKDGEDEREECEKKAKDDFADNHWYFWEIDHIYSWLKMRLVVGTDYSTGVGGRFVSTWSLIPSLVRIWNKYPVWFVYDYKWWLWFVWCKVNPSWFSSLVNNCKENLNNCFKLNSGLTWVDTESLASSFVDCTNGVWSSKDTLLSIVIDWVVWLGKDSKNDWYVWNLSDDKMQLFSSVDINNTKLINYARQKAEILCRGKWINDIPTSDVESKVVCLNANSSNTFDATNDKVKWKTLIVKWWANVKIKPGTGYLYDIFVDWGNLLIDESDEDVQLVIESSGFYSESLSSGNFSKYSEFLVRFHPENVASMIGRFGDYNSTYTYCSEIPDTEDREICTIFWSFVSTLTFLTNYSLGNYNKQVALASVINWNFIVNWKVESNGGGLLNNRYFIYWKFTTKDTLSDLEEVFWWRCKNWKATDTDNSYCIQDAWNPYSYAALAIIDQNHESPLLK